MSDSGENPRRRRWSSSVPEPLWTRVERSCFRAEQPDENGSAVLLRVLLVKAITRADGVVLPLPVNEGNIVDMSVIGYEPRIVMSHPRMFTTGARRTERRMQDRCGYRE